MVTKGSAAPEVADTYGRARLLCEQLGDRQQIFPVLFGLWRSSHGRAHLQTARELGQQLLGLAKQQCDRALLVEAHGALGQTFCIRGEPTLAREHFDELRALYVPQRHTALAFGFSYDPGVYAPAVESWVLWLLGFPEQALRRSREALTLARAQAHPIILSLTLATVAIVQHMRREGAATLEHTTASLALSTEHGFAHLKALGVVLQGWGLAREGQVAAGIAHMHQGLAASRETGAELLRSYLLALLAEAYGRGGQIEAGLGALEEGLIAADAHAQRFYEAELHRLKGELLRQQSAGAAGKPAVVASLQGSAAGAEVTDPPPVRIEAEACCQRALDIARRQGAKSLELRAAMSCYRLWARHERGVEARSLRTEVYEWFTEGFDTADLQEASNLLAERA
jgi:predicted ATPase